MVKKVLFIIFAVLFGGIIMTSCETDNSDDVLNNSSDLSYSYGTESIDIEGIKNSGETLFDSDVIPNKDIAVEYAKIIMSGTLKKDINNYKVIDVVFDKNQGIWNFNFCIDRDTIGGNIDIILSQKTGEVKLICFGE